jgi:hypothetical protein
LSKKTEFNSSVETQRAAKFSVYLGKTKKKVLRCELCALEFHRSNEFGAHNRYKHGAGLRRARPDGTPTPAPERAKLARFMPERKPVPIEAINAAWIRIPREPQLCVAIAERIGRIVADVPRDECEFWNSLQQHLADMALSRVREREIETSLTRQFAKKKARFVSFVSSADQLG